MRAKLLCSLLVLLGVAVFAPLTGRAAEPKLDGAIGGIELAPQSLVGAAVFVFDYRGLVDGRVRRGWGWMAITHEDLPTGGEVAMITGGFGEIYIGLRRFDVDVYLGMLTLNSDHGTTAFDDDFDVYLSADISNFFGQTRAHDFHGLLSHKPFPPTIVGQLVPE
jgi:hypothetical protein